MAIYLISMFLVYFFLVLSKKDRCSNKILVKKICISIALLIMVIIAGIRYGVGTDYFIYTDMFYNSDKLRIFGEYKLELVFLIYCKISHLFFSKPTILFTMVAFTIYLTVFKSAIRNNKNYELTIFLFIAFSFYVNSFNVMRQWMAIPLLFLGMDYINEKNYKKGIPILIFGFLCHYTSIIAIFIYFLCKYIKKDSTRIIIMLLAIIVYFNLDSLMHFAYEIISSTGKGTKYYKYFINDHYYTTRSSFFSFPMITLLTYVGYLLFIPKDERKKFTTNQNFLINTVVFGFACALLGTINITFQRLQLYFIYSIIFIIPLIIEKTNKQYGKLFYFMCIILGTLLYIYSLYKNGGNPLPYITIFS